MIEMARHSIMRRILHWWFVLKRPMTLGVRVIVEDDEQRVLLVRHTYVPGWHLPGGGVENGESMVEAAKKEVLEEAGIEVFGPLELRGIFFNRHASKRDHVALYRAQVWKQAHPFEPTGEIAEIGFFDQGSLPESTTAGTVRRIEEVYGERTPSDDW